MAADVRLIFLGPPGAGKGTQAQLIASFFSIPHISTGEILRAAIAGGTPLGLQAQGYVDRGELVPDSLILDLIRERLQKADASHGWILDGFPRNVSQAEFLDSLLGELNQDCDVAINLEVPDETLLERLLSRGRKDDNKETISRRLDVYRKLTAPVIDYYQRKQMLESVNGDRPLEEVNTSLKAILSAKAK